MLAKVPQQVLAHRMRIVPQQRLVQVGQIHLVHVPTAPVKVNFGRNFVPRVVLLTSLVVPVVRIMDVNLVVPLCGAVIAAILFKHARMV